METSKTFIDENGELNIYCSGQFYKPKFRRKTFRDYLREAEDEIQKYDRIRRLRDRCIEMGHLKWADEIDEYYLNNDD